MGRQYHIMSSVRPFSTISSALRPAVMTLLAMASFPGLSGQSNFPSGGGGAAIHAGWQMGPIALHTERNHSFGAHHLGNTGYGQSLTIQSAFKGPWELEIKADRSAVVTDDGALRAWKTEIQSGTFMVNWVWKAEGDRRDEWTRFASISQGFQPFVGIGIAHVDHIMKQDLEDAFGRRYHLWSDGTLRDRDQAGDHDGNAMILKRDYTYESDVDGGAYPTSSGRSLAIPAQIGIRLDVSPRVRARMGIGGWLGLTDQVDDQISGRILAGDAMASGFFGLGIRLGKLAAKPALPEDLNGLDVEEAMLLAGMDTDGDGVNNLYDRCPGTRGMAVDEHGCPLDSDGDGYADHRDAEVHSPHHDVDARGVAQSEGAASGGDKPFRSPKSDWDEVRGRVTSDDRTQYAMRIAIPEAGWTLAEQYTLMAFQHLEEASGAVEVRVGHDPLEAGKAARTVRAAGLDAEIIAPEVERPAGSIAEEAAPVSVAHYRVQLGAFRTPDPEALSTLFDGIDVVRLQGEDGMTRIVSGAFTDRGEAIRFKVGMRSIGFSGAFITTHEPATAQGTPLVAETLPEQEFQAPSFDATRISFRIQLGALKSRMSTEAMDGLLEVGDVEHLSSTGWHRYLHGRFDTAELARAALPTLQAAGFPDAFVVGDVSGRIIPVAEAELLLRQD